MTDDLKGKNLRLEITGGWRYGGQCTKTDNDFLTIHDTRSGHTVMVRRDQILRLEVLS